MVNNSKIIEWNTDFFLELQFEEENGRKNEKWYWIWVINKSEKEREFQDPDGSQVHSVEGTKIKYYDHDEDKDSAEDDVIYFFRGKVYSEKYSFRDVTTGGPTSIDKLHALPHRKSRMQCAISFKNNDNGFPLWYKFKPKNRSWEKSRVMDKKGCFEGQEGEGLHGYDVIYDDGEKDKLFTDSKGNIYSANHSYNQETKTLVPCDFLIGAGTLPPYTPEKTDTYTNTSDTGASTKRSIVTPCSTLSSKKRRKTSPATTPHLARIQTGMVTHEQSVCSLSPSSPHEQSVCSTSPSSPMEGIVTHVSVSSSWTSPGAPNPTSSSLVCSRCSDHVSHSEEENKNKEISEKVAELEKIIKKKENVKRQLEEALKNLVIPKGLHLKSQIIKVKEGIQLVHDLLLFLKGEKAYSENEWGETKLKRAFKRIHAHFAGKNERNEIEQKISGLMPYLESIYPDENYVGMSLTKVLGDHFEKIGECLKHVEAELTDKVKSIIEEIEMNTKLEERIKSKIQYVIERTVCRKRKLQKLLESGSTNN